MKTVRQLGFDVLRAIFSGRRFGGNLTFFEETAISGWFSLSYTISEYEKTGGHVGQKFYVWGPALGLQKLELAEAKTFETAIRILIESTDHSLCPKLPTHIIRHDWGTAGGQEYNNCNMHRFDHALDDHLMKMIR